MFLDISSLIPYSIYIKLAKANFKNKYQTSISNPNNHKEEQNV